MFTDSTVRALQALAPFSSIHACTDANEPVISIAAVGTQLEVVEELVRLGASLNGMRVPPLYMAIRNEYYDTARYLIDMGALPTRSSIKRVLESHSRGSIYLDILFRPRIVDITESHHCDTSQCESTVVTEPLHVHLWKNPEYIYAIMTSGRCVNYDVLETLVQNGADPSTYYENPVNEISDYFIERGVIYRTAIYAYLCAREAYGRDIARLIAQQILKLRPSHYHE
jgi:hypothetical protein